MRNNNIVRISNYSNDIESLKYILKHTSYKDSDIRAEIRQEIYDKKFWIRKLTREK